MLSVIWAVYAAILVYAAVSDARTYRIPNWTSIALVVLFALAVLIGRPGWPDFWPHLAMGAAAFAVGYLLYHFTGMGAGDAKLGAAVALWAGWSGGYGLLVALTAAMAILALTLIIIRRIFAARSEVEPSIRAFQKNAPVPLGVAISAAGVIASFGYAPVLWAF